MEEGSCDWQPHHWDHIPWRLGKHLEEGVGHELGWLLAVSRDVHLFQVKLLRERRIPHLRDERLRQVEELVVHEVLGHVCLLRHKIIRNVRIRWQEGRRQTRRRRCLWQRNFTDGEVA